MAQTGAPGIWRGIALLIAAVSIFALCDVATKYLTERYPVTLILGLRYLVNLLLLLAILRPRRLSLRRPGMVLLRGLSLASGSVFVGLALRFMPVGETVAILYVSPLFVMLCAAPLLGERVARTGWIAAGCGFAGVLLIVSPGGGLSLAGVVLALLCAVVTAAYHLLSRLLSRTETTGDLVISAALTGTVLFVPAVPFALPPALPPLFDMAVLGLLGLMVTVSHILFTAAYREAPATVLAPFNYLHLVFAALLGLAVFHHLPTPAALAGIALVIAGGVLAALSAPARAG